MNDPTDPFGNQSAQPQTRGDINTPAEKATFSTRVDAISQLHGEAREAIETLRTWLTDRNVTAHELELTKRKLKRLQQSLTSAGIQGRNEAERSANMALILEDDPEALKLEADIAAGIEALNLQDVEIAYWSNLFRLHTNTLRALGGSD